ncbi:MAG: hypothetical protein AAFS03_10870, partial [Pseudomonadota bacterium]
MSTLSIWDGPVPTDNVNIAKATVTAAIKEYERFFGGNHADVTTSDSRDGDAVVVTVAGVPVTVMQIDKPLPDDAIQPAVELNRTWPSAKAEIAKQAGHLIVANLSKIEDHAS